MLVKGATGNIKQVQEFVAKGHINNNPFLVEIMDKGLDHWGIYAQFGDLINTLAELVKMQFMWLASDKRDYMYSKHRAI